MHCRTTRRAGVWSNQRVPSAEGHHRPLNARRPPTVATTFPGLSTLRHYERGWLRGDVLAGITVAAYLMPQVMAYAEVAGLPPVAGLLGDRRALLVYAVFGSSRQLSVGPESTTALMTAVAVAPLAAGDPDAVRRPGRGAGGRRRRRSASWAARRLGFLADLLSKPVLVGYMAGVAVLMIVEPAGEGDRHRVAGTPSWPRSRFVRGTRTTSHRRPRCSPPRVLAFLLVGSGCFPGAPAPLHRGAARPRRRRAVGLRDQGSGSSATSPAGLPVAALPDVDGRRRRRRCSARRSA